MSFKFYSFLLLVCGLCLSPFTHAQQTENTVATKTKAVKKQPNPWSAHMFTEFSFNDDHTKNGHYSEFDLNYEITPITSLMLWSGYSGPMQTTEENKADFFDPEFGVDFTVPLQGNLKNFNFLASAGFAIPVSEQSRKDQMNGAVFLGAGLNYAGRRWKIEQSNNVYLYGYKHRSDGEDIGDSDSSADLSSSAEDDSVEDSSASQIMASTENQLRIRYRITRKLSWGSRVRYMTDIPKEGTIDERLSTGTSLSYRWTPNIVTYGGLATATTLSDEKAPALFHQKTLSSFIGIDLSI